MDKFRIRTALIKIIKGELNEKTYNAESFTNDEILSIYELAKLHDLAHVVTEWCFKNNLMITNPVFMQKQVFTLQRFEQMNSVLDSVIKVFEKAQIPFIPLKGSVLRNYYPNPTIRTSCDIDVLIKKADLKRAESILIKELGYTPFHKDTHDIAFSTPNDITLELHFDLIEKNVVGVAEKPLANVWKSAILKAGTKFHYVLSDELFYYYHIIHMAKHFLNGGCGIRSVMDVWVLNNKIPFDKEKRDDLLKSGNLLKFANKMETLCEIWFGDSETSSEFENVESYIIFGGTYGNAKNEAIVKSTVKTHKFSYLISRIWVPYETLKFEYPSLNGKKYLILFYQIHRWFRFIFTSKKRKFEENKKNSVVNAANSQKAREMLDFLGLD